MADVRSKNLYELLGNDPELDPNRAPEPPTRAVDRTQARVGKRDAPKEAPAAAPAAQPRSDNRRGGRATGNEAAFRDRNAGRNNNREKPTEDGAQAPRRREGGRRDRQSRTGQTDTRKQVNQGWGGQSGEKELDDERAGEKIAQNDETEPQTPAEESADPAEKTKSYNDYLAEKAAAGDLSAKPVRAANEGSKLDKKWAGAKEFKRAEGEDEYIKGSTDKSQREKQRKQKNYLDVDMRFVEPPRTGGREGAPRGRGGRGGAGRGARGGRGGPAAGGPRGGPAPVPVDEKNFPSLGGK